MEIGTNETVSQGTHPILQVKRPLLPIDEYASREGVSRRTVEERVDSGIIQIRKYKGKTYVVDVPLSPYHHAPHELCLLEEDPKMEIQFSQQSTDSYQDQVPDTDPPRSSVFTSSTWTKRIQHVAAVTSLACLFAVILASLWLYINQTIHRDRIDQAYASIEEAYKNSIQTSQQLAALQNNLLESTAELESLKSELGSTKGQVTNLHKELNRVSQALEAAAGKPADSTEQATNLRNLLGNTRAEVQGLSNEITLVNQRLETTQQQNAKTLEELRGQIQNLTTLLSALAEKTQVVTDSEIPDE